MDDVPTIRKGRLLVASPALVDPNFRRTVVLMLEHSDEGALGLVLNRPTPLVARQALPSRMAGALPEQERVHEGGPVQPDAVIVLAEFRDLTAAAAIAFGRVGVVDPSTEVDVLRSQVTAIRAFGGYAGWSAGQLEREIEEEAWIDAEGLPEDVFTDELGRMFNVTRERIRPSSSSVRGFSPCSP